MAESEEKTIHFTEAEFQRVLDNWKASMTPQLIQAAKDTAANILETYADAIGKADVKASTPESKVEVEAALGHASEMARGMATQLRNAIDGDSGVVGR